MNEIFKNAHISLKGKTFTLFLNNEPILSDVLREDDDWFGFEINGNEYDLNIWIDDSEMKSSVYQVIEGNTNTSVYVGVKILIGNTVLPAGWISVKEKLPESGKYTKVLTLTEWGEGIEYWKGSYWESEYPVKEATVTHWMPMPVLPTCG